MTETSRERAGAGGWRVLAAGQGVFYLATGVWPVLHMPSFEAVTGPKTDDWLVRLVGALIAVIGGLLLSAAQRGRLTVEAAGIGVGFPVVLGVVDVVYVTNGTISRIYLLDAAAEAVLVAWWAVVFWRARRAV